MRDLLPGMVRVSDIGVNLEELRKSAGISQDKMAVMCGVSGLTYIRWERGVTQTIKKCHFDKLVEVVEECKRRISDSNAK